MSTIVVNDEHQVRKQPTPHSSNRNPFKETKKEIKRILREKATTSNDK
jgi:hypothetical protein